MSGKYHVGFTSAFLLTSVSLEEPEIFCVSLTTAGTQQGISNVENDTAGVMVLESLEHAQERGAPILAEFVGGAYSCDAHHMTEPTPSGTGVALCIRRCHSCVTS